MNIKFSFRLLSTICFLYGFSSLPLAYGSDMKEEFAQIWKDSSNREIAMSCLQNLRSNDDELLKLTKHLIGSNKHLIDISEIGERLPISFLTIFSDDNNSVNFLKFLRAFYNLGSKGSPLKILSNEGSKTSAKKKAVRDLIGIFNYVTNIDNCTRIQDITRRLYETLGLEEEKQEALEKARAFCRQLNAEERNLENLAEKLSDEINKVYKAAGLDTSTLESLANSPGKIDQFKQDPTELIACINDTIISQIKFLDFSKDIQNIKDLIADVFENRILDEAIKETFLRFTKSYLKNFVELYRDLPNISKNKNNIPDSAQIHFRRTFSAEQFKLFVTSSLGRDDIPKKEPVIGPLIDLVFKSDFYEPQDSSIIESRNPSIQVNEETYSIKTSFFATFFPHVPGSSNH